ncbi:hypothetical protein [Flavobacterium sp.]|uniref:hypothetical protein n=1 Tax=Flavobacterium sp. TaxID=239 RepID=UPI00286E141E|nr:hypothetical protein [Flavobacterium sp.]
MKTTFYLFLTLFFITISLQAQKTVKPNTAAIADSLKTIFYQNAKFAKLTDKKTNELLKIIDERNKVVAGFIAKRERHNAPFNVQDPWVMYNYKIDQAQKYYAKKINNLLSYAEYAQFVIVNFKEEAELNSKLELKQVLDSNPNLTKEQQQQLYNLIFEYQLNLLMTGGYYNFDQMLQKSKKGAWSFTFEKEFAKTCKEFNIKIDKLKESSANNFQWN